jgi:hypothetical protein
MCRDLFVVSFIFAFSGCMGQTKPNHTGIVNVEFQLYTKLATPGFKQSHRVWYKDNRAIKEIKVTKFKTDENDKQTVEEAVKYYLFANLDSNFFYEYDTFSDTASLKRKYFEKETTKATDATELYFKKNIDYSGTPEPLTDTTIENIVYKRIRFKRKLGKDDVFTIAYFRCDIENPLFVINRYSGQNCPIVKVYDYPPGLSGPVESLEVKHLSDTLTPEEIKVFQAWERNARKNPVNK